MNKGLEALKELKRQIGNLEFIDFRNGLPQRTTYLVKDTSLFNDIETELKRLEEIDKHLTFLPKTQNSYDVDTLIKQEEVLRIIKEYQVDVAMLIDCQCEEEYLNRLCNRYLASREKLGYKRLGKEKFDLLKEWLK